MDEEILNSNLLQVGVAAFDLRSASLHLSQYIETSSSYQNTKTLLEFYEKLPMTVDFHFPYYNRLCILSDDSSGLKFCLIFLLCMLKDCGLYSVRSHLIIAVLEIIEYNYLIATRIPNSAFKDAKSFFAQKCLRVHMFSCSENEKYASIRKSTLKQSKSLSAIAVLIPCIMFSTSLEFVCSECLMVGEANELLIGEVIDEDVRSYSGSLFVARTQQCFAVKAGVDGLLDMARRSFCDTPAKARVFTLAFHKRAYKEKLPNKFIQVIKLENKACPVTTYIVLALELASPNNIFLSEASNVVIVMGPNMSGKSTYLQQVCLIVILAQIGCYIPARYATLRVIDRIFTRMGTIDCLESNSSTFMTEMKETAFIMQNISKRSLVVMDELGRATSSSDGFAMAWSCCEHLLALKAYTIFATHMENLSELAIIYPNVKILHFYVEVKNNRMDFKFQLRDGQLHVPHYGLMLAGVAGLPSSVVETAKRITSTITQKKTKRLELLRLSTEKTKRLGGELQQYRDIQMIYRVSQRLICLKYSNQDEDSLRESLQNLKESYISENPTGFNHRASIPNWFQLVFLPSSVVDQLIFTQLNTHHISSLALLAYPHLGFQRINLPGGHRVPEEYPGVRLRHHRGHTRGAEGNGGMLTGGSAPEIIAPDNN
nr:DNA mismatch repair protein MSH4 [Ipomoea batatas]